MNRKNSTITFQLRSAITSNRPERLFAVIIALSLLSATYIRLYFGVSFTDESYYIAIPHRFVLGDTPFRDESSSLFSMFSFLSYPFFLLFDKVTGSSEGIVLFARHLYLLFQLAVSAGVFRISRNFVNTPESLLIAACVFAFIPFNLPSLSYNTLACGLLTLGLLAGAWGAVAKRFLLIALSGCLLALCSVVYPPLLIVAFLVLVLLSVVERNNYIPFLLGGFIALGLLAPFFIHAEWSLLKENFNYVRSIGAQGGSWKKLVLLVLKPISRLWPAILVSGLVLVPIRKNPSTVALTASALLPVMLLIGIRSPVNYVAAHGFILALALSGLWLYSRLKENDKLFFKLVWIPAYAASIVMGFSSSNGYMNSGIGFMAGGIVSLLMILVTLRGEGEDTAQTGKWARLMLVSMTAAVLVYCQYGSVYMESPVGKLTETVASGPFKYLRTTPENKHFIKQISDDLLKASAGSRSIVFYYDFPAGYLLSNLKPATNAVWLFSAQDYPHVDTSLLNRYYMNPARQPDVIVKINRITWGYNQYKTEITDVNHPIDRLLSQGSYRIVAEQGEYAIYRKKQ